ncbi:embryonic polyadenylate-binding protein 2 [Haemorhous mexicanus]|uniref:embryonic polyadenylate-binding protein 2 n=1 Tax=Haemorhous mexicanus TaxID=30427 RepID=UPI0028BDACC9|nr:embryonic polyadenylate-binding protein 2 [Haemorhous mexicanus]
MGTATARAPPGHRPATAWAPPGHRLGTARPPLRHGWPPPGHRLATAPARPVTARPPLPGLPPGQLSAPRPPYTLNGCWLNALLPLIPPSPLFLDTSEIWWQDPPSLQAEAAPWDVAEVAAVCKAADEGSDPSPQEGNSTEEQDVQDPELEAIKAKLREIEKEDERLKELQLEAENHLFMSSEAALFPLTTKEKMEADQRSIYVGNVDYGGTAEELESHFNSCGQINRVTILCDKFSGHPKGYAYIEFEEQSSVKAAVELDESVFRGRVIKVLPKRTNMPGISSTDRGGYRGCFHARGGLGRWGGPYGQQPRVRGRTYRGRARLLPWYFPY